MKTNLFLVIFAIVAVSLSSCKKEDQTISPEPVPPPLILKYNLADSLSFFINNNDSNQVAYYVGKYFIKLGYQGSDEFDVAFPQHDSGNIYFAGEKKSAYMGLMYESTFQGYILKAKFGHNQNDFVATPGILTDTTLFFTLKNKISGRSIEIPAQEFLKQGSLMVWYDVIQQ